MNVRKTSMVPRLSEKVETREPNVSEMLDKTKSVAAFKFWGGTRDKVNLHSFSVDQRSMTVSVSLSLARPALERAIVSYKIPIRSSRVKMEFSLDASAAIFARRSGEYKTRSK